MLKIVKFLFLFTIVSSYLLITFIAKKQNFHFQLKEALKVQKIAKNNTKLSINFLMWKIKNKILNISGILLKIKKFTRNEKNLMRSIFG